MPVSSYEHNNKNIVTCTKQSSQLIMPPDSNDDIDSDFEVIQKNKGTKR